jgi:YHS domain-containing protein
MLRTRDHPTMNDSRHVEPNEDPVCGMQVDVEAARAKGLSLTHDGREYVFCGKGCLLEFRDDPRTFLDPRHLPTM